MAEIQRTQTFPYPMKHCFESLLKVWPAVEIEIKSSEADTFRSEAHWIPGGGARMIIRSECRDAGGGLTQVILRHDMGWTPILSRPNVSSEKAALAFNERIFAKMDKVLEVLGKYMEDETSLPRITASAGLDLDHIAWIAGSIISIGLRLMVGLARPTWLPGSASGTQGQLANLRILSVVGVLVGGITAGLLKRRNPLKGSAFFEGVIVALANVWLSTLIYRPFFMMGWVDWGIYGLTGLTSAALASMRVGRNTD